MNKYNLDISVEQIHRVFPFHIIFDASLKVMSLGKSNVKMRLSDVNEAFNQAFAFERPFIEHVDFEQLKNISNELIYLKCLHNPTIILRGQFEYFEKEDFIMFIGSPWFSKIDDLKNNNLTIQDFANFDPLLDLLHVMQSQQITNDEIKELLISVNEQKKKTDLSNQQLKLLQSFLDSSTDAIQVATIEGDLFYINDEASLRLGINRENLSAYNVRDFEKVFEDPLAWVGHIADLRKNEKIILEGINTNQANGSSFPVEVTVKLTKIGDKEYVIASSRDITNRKAIENRLIKQEKKYRNIIANMNLGLIEVDLDDTILFANQSFAHISGYSMDELIGMKTRDVIKVKDDADIDAKNHQSKYEIADSYEVQITNKEGEEKWWFISSAPNLNDEGELTGSIGIHLDITNQKLLERELELAKDTAEEASKAKEAFLANMSHEIRTPLNAIIGMIRELKKESLTNTQKTYLNHTDSASRHLLSIVNNILDISKIEAGEFKLEKHHFSLDALTANIQSILMNKAKLKNLDFKCTIDKSVFKAHLGDSARLRQVLINLIDNAIKFTEKGYIDLQVKVIESKENTQDIQFVLTDTGVGMNKDYLSQLFSKFSQEELSTTRKYGGTGLGMSITHNIVLMMGGKIDVWSEKNKGTKITIDLSFEKGDAQKLREEDIASFNNGLQNINVLLVEDNTMNRFIASKSLEFFGCKITEAENGKEALKKIQEDVFDIILMDIQMPEMDGVETTQKIRENFDKNVPIIALTANAFRKDLDHYLKIGMNDYVSKPFQEAELFFAIRNHVKIEGDQVVMVSPEKYTYDLSKLREVGSGNESFVKKMVEIFIDSIPQALDEMQIALQNKNYDQVSKIAHRIKPNMDYLGISEIYELTKELEVMSLENDISHPVIENMSIKIRKGLLAVIEELKQEFG